MTDFDITRLCAQAMGYEIIEPTEFYPHVTAVFNDEIQPYFPFKDDAQAMALVKKCNLTIALSVPLAGWYVAFPDPEIPSNVNVDLNRAICECVAKMQSSKKA